MDITLHDNLTMAPNAPPVESSTTRQLPIDMRFNDGHRISIFLYTLLMIGSAIVNIYVFGAIVRLRTNGKRSRISLFQLHLSIADLLVTFLMMPLDRAVAMGYHGGPTGPGRTIVALLNSIQKGRILADFRSFIHVWARPDQILATALPLEIGWNATVSWEAGDAMCRIMSFFRIFGLYLSGFVIMCISLDCYFAVVKPFGMLNANRRGKIMLWIAWIASFICSAPQPAIFHVETHPEFEWYQQCVTFNSFPSARFELVYNMFGFVFLYFLPLVTIIGCYSCIVMEIYRINARQRIGDGLRRSNMGVLGRAKIKTLKMTVIIVITFFLCWTPYNIMSLWYWFDKTSAQKVDQRIQKAFFLFACTNSCTNPIIYGLFRFRRTGNSIQRQEFNAPAAGRNARFQCRWRPTQCCVTEVESESFGNTPGVSSSSIKENQMQMIPIRRLRTRGLGRRGVGTRSDPVPSTSDVSISIRLVRSETPCHDFGSEV